MLRWLGVVDDILVTGKSDGVVADERTLTLKLNVGLVADAVKGGGIDTGEVKGVTDPPAVNPGDVGIKGNTAIGGHHQEGWSGC